MSYFKYHVFICTNQRDSGKDSCANQSSARLRDYAKDQVKALNLSGKGKVRINSAGCLGRCDDGPVMVVYPEEVWYTYLDEQDIDEIIEGHLLKGCKVERLCIK